MLRIETIDFLVRDVALVLRLVDVDAGRELALGERPQTLVLALLVRGVRLVELELLERLPVLRADAFDVVVDRAELRVGAVEAHLERRVVDAEQHVALRDSLVLVHVDLDDRARDPRAHDADVGFHVRVVGADEAAGREIDVQRADEHDDGAEHEQHGSERPAARLRRGGRGRSRGWGSLRGSSSRRHRRGCCGRGRCGAVGAR